MEAVDIRHTYSNEVPSVTDSFNEVASNAIYGSHSVTRPRPSAKNVFFLSNDSTTPVAPSIYLNLTTRDRTSAASRSGWELSLPRLSSPLALPAHLLPAFREAVDLRHLEDGWDGEGSIEPKRENLSNAMLFLFELPDDVSVPEIGSTFEGDVEWYWKSELGVATVNFHTNGVTYFARAREASTQGSFQAPFSSLPSDLISILRKI